MHIAASSRVRMGVIDVGMIDVTHARRRTLAAARKLQAQSQLTQARVGKRLVLVLVERGR